MERRVHEFTVVILEDESGGYIAIVPELPGQKLVLRPFRTG